MIRFAASLALVLMAMPATAADPKPGVKTSESGGIGSQPATVAEILNGVSDCVAAVHQHGKVDFDKLEASGWQFAGKQQGKVSAGSASIPTTQLFFGKENVIQLIQMTGVSASCQTIALVTDGESAEKLVRTGLTERFGAVAASDYKGDEAFKASIDKLTPGSLAHTMINDTNRFGVVSMSKNGKSIINITMTPKITD